jgi:hypothetical protein
MHYARREGAIGGVRISRRTRGRNEQQTVPRAGAGGCFEGVQCLTLKGGVSALKISQK